MPLNDHVLLLQLERAQEVLKDEVEAVVDTDAFADVDHDHDEYAWDSHDHDDEYADAEHSHPGLAEHLDEHDARLDTLEQAVGIGEPDGLEKRVDRLHDALLELTGISIDTATQLEKAQRQILTQQEMITSLLGRVTVAEQETMRLQNSTDARFKTTGEHLAIFEGDIVWLKDIVGQHADSIEEAGTKLDQVDITLADTIRRLRGTSNNHHGL